MVSGSLIKRMDKEYLLSLMDLFMRDSGMQAK